MLIYVISIAALILLLGCGLFFQKKHNAKSCLPTDSLSKPRQGFIQPLQKLLKSCEIKKVIPELEELLLSADVGVTATHQLLEALQSDRAIKDGEQATQFVKDKMMAILTPQKDFVLPLHRPVVLFFVGVNGTGKTTTIGKLATQWHQQGLKTMLVAADTFRAAAKEQLEVWAHRSQSELMGGQSYADPASVIFDGIQKAKNRGVDIVLVDTAGRLHTKTSLMEELKKMVRVSEKALGRAPDEIFLILDATTGQNGLSQASLFQAAVSLTGLILTKFDGTAKGGILLSVVQETGLPLCFVGVGEGVDDLKKFDAREFVEKLFSCYLG